MTRNFDVQARVDGELVEVALAGDLDMAATFRLEPELDGLMARADVRELVVDVAGVTFVDSAGLGTLLSTGQRARELGIEMAVVNPSPAVIRVLDVTSTRYLLHE